MCQNRHTLFTFSGHEIYSKCGLKHVTSARKFVFRMNHGGILFFGLNRKIIARKWINNHLTTSEFQKNWTWKLFFAKMAWIFEFAKSLWTSDIQKRYFRNFSRNTPLHSNGAFLEAQRSLFWSATENPLRFKTGSIEVQDRLPWSPKQVALKLKTASLEAWRCVCCIPEGWDARNRASKKRVCQNRHTLVFIAKPRLSQARALLCPGFFVPLDQVF